MKSIVCGLCKGRHELPVKEYIFDSFTDMPSCDELYDIAKAFVLSHAEKERVWLSDELYNDYQVEAYTSELVVYVTGYTPMLLAVVSVCSRLGMRLTAMHYNATGEYYAQKVLDAQH